jgi:hypothetical protein
MDELDLFILSKIYDTSKKKQIKIGLYNIASVWCKKLGKEIKGYNIKKNIQLMKIRLRRMEKMGLIFIDKEINENHHKNKNHYILILDNIDINKHNIRGKYYLMISLKLNNLWCSFQLVN